MNQEMKIKCQVINDYPLPRPERIPGFKPMALNVTEEEIPIFISGQTLQFYFKGGLFCVNVEVACKLLELIRESKSQVVYRDGKRGVMVFHEIDRDAVIDKLQDAVNSDQQ